MKTKMSQREDAFKGAGRLRRRDEEVLLLPKKNSNVSKSVNLKSNQKIRSTLTTVSKKCTQNSYTQGKKHKTVKHLKKIQCLKEVSPKFGALKSREIH